MDLSYAAIPVFGGELKRLYRENQLAYIISDAKNLCKSSYLCGRHRLWIMYSSNR
jgi:hypothetical protein